jgi:CzcA family heavy metal efflux pump
MKRFVAWLDKNHIAIAFTVLVLLVTSVYMFFDMPKDVFPNARFPRFQIIADIGFASLENTEINITRPLEETLKTVPGVVEVRSVTERGTSTIDLYLKWGTNLDESYQYVQSKISQARSALPPDTDIEVIQMNTSAFPMSEYGIWSDTMTLRELYLAAKYRIVPRLIGIDGIYALSVIGGEEPEISVELNPGKLIQYNLDVASISSSIDSANRISFIGNVQKGDKAFFTVGGNKLENLRDIGGVVVATRMGKPVLLRDIADIRDFRAETRRIVSVNGHKGLFIDVQKQEEADGLKVSRQFDSRIAEIEKEFNGALHISKWDLTDYVGSSIRGILLDILVGVLIILLIVYYIMNRFRYSLPVILVLPVVIILEFLVLKLLGMTVNIMTLGGLSVAIGIIADNAIVVTENYIRFRSEGQANPLAESMSYIVPITVWATLVSIIVFIPLNILSGTTGLFFRPLAVTLATTIVLSLIMAVTLLPVLIKYFIEHHREKKQYSEHIFFLRLKKWYLRLLNTALKYRVTVSAATAVVICAAVFVFLRIPTGFLPEWDEGDIVFDYIAPAGTSIYGTDSILNRIEEIIKAEPETGMYIRKTGTHLGTPFAASTVGEIVIYLKKDRKRSTFEIIDELREKVTKDFPEVETDFFQMLTDRIGDLTGVAKPIVVNIIGNDMGELWSGAQLVKQKLEAVRGLNDVLIDMPPAQKEIKVSADQGKVSLLGLTVSDVSRYAQLALYGEEVFRLARGLQLVPIRDYYKGNYRNDISAISNIPIYTPNGGVLPLGKLAEFRMIDQNPEIHHKNGSIVVNVNAEISGRALGDVVKDIKSALATVPRNSFSLELGGNYQSQQTSFRELLFVLGISIILILALLLFIFESYKTSLAIFIGTLASATFVIFGLFITGIQFDVSSFTGMITVMGIVVNNGILVIDFVERFRKEGKKIREAVNAAGNLRFRPVLITNLAAIAGFLPMALNIGQGGEVLRPFSVAMISGLIGSMFFSLIVMPVFYEIIHGEADIS